MKRLFLISFVCIISLSVDAQSRPNNFYPPTSKREMERVGMLSSRIKNRLTGNNPLIIRKADNNDYYYQQFGSGQTPVGLKPLNFHRYSQFGPGRNLER